ncbi:glucose PTS transporter subunit IIA [[Eubacterium] hominis]|uniref:glucose PTS transporter subunit IIA n=1 Tax=[Eubacterium] hominis TaxID=2764325 RepID=UPI003A4E5BCF
MKQEAYLVAPVDGTCVDLSKVPDDMFSDKIMGDGVAFQYQGDTLYAPCNATIQVVAQTKHAIGMISDEGLEILLHVGVETVNLNGKGFQTLVEEGQHVEVGTPLLKIDRTFMEKEQIDLITPMIMTNQASFTYTIEGLGKAVKHGESNIIRYKDANKQKEGTIMKYQTLCEDIIQHIGGKDNVISVTHCVTRLRFKLKNEEKANTEVLSKMKGVMKIIQTGGQYQVVIGTHVEDVYRELIQIGGFKSEQPLTINEDADTKKQGLLSRFLILMSGIFQPILSILMASGMIKALLKLVVLAGWLSDTSGTYTILNSMGDALFYFFPIAVGYSASRKFGIKEIYGITLGAVLSYPAISALSSQDVLYTVFQGTLFESNVYAEFLGIPVLLPGAGYAGSVIPIILIVFVAAKIYKALNTHLPAMIRSFFVPFLTLMITVPLAFVIIGPIAMFIQGLLSEAIQLIINLNAGIAGLVIGSLWSVLVMFGLHMPIIMMFNVNIATYGYDIINPLIFSGALASMGAVLGVIIRTKSVQEKNIAVPALFSTFFGVNEPALYGVLIPRKKIMFSCFLAAGIGSMIAGFCGAKLYAFGASGPLGLPCFINPNGIDMGFIGLCIGAVVSFILALAAALFIGDKKDENAIKLGEE